MARLSASKARADFADVIDRVRHHGERILLHRRGKNVAAMVSIQDLKLIEDLEDRADVDEIKRRLAEPGQPIPWEQVKQTLGLAPARKRAAPRRTQSKK